MSRSLGEKKELVQVLDRCKNEVEEEEENKYRRRGGNYVEWKSSGLLAWILVLVRETPCLNKNSDASVDFFVP